MIKKQLFLTILSLSVIFFCSAQYKSANKEAIVKLVTVSAGSEKTFKASGSQIVNSLQQPKPEISKEFWNSFSEEMLKTLMTELIDLPYPVNQNRFPLTEVNGIIAFHESSLSRKIKEKTPFIIQESLVTSQQWGIKIGSEIAKHLKQNNAKHVNLIVA